jgi:hypothetical protein
MPSSASTRTCIATAGGAGAGGCGGRNAVACGGGGGGQLGAGGGTWELATGSSERSRVLARTKNTLCSFRGAPAGGELWRLTCKKDAVHWLLSYTTCYHKQTVLSSYLRDQGNDV